MKNKYLIITVIVAVFTFNSCNKWLDVIPRSEIRESVLLSTEDGYKYALNGVYILLADADLYGKNMTMYFPEVLCRHWAMAASSDSDDEKVRIANFDYANSDVEGLIAKIWIKYYNAIAQLNSILENLESTDIPFSYNCDKLTRGEILGLRAFLHLDVLRYFGPVPAEADATKNTIPYVSEFTTDPNKLISIPYSKVLEDIENDLNEAEQALEADPVRIYSNSSLRNPSFTADDLSPDKWMHYRQVRFNYFAVLATKARFYHWIGEKAQAVEYAKKVIEAVDADNIPKYTLADEYSFSNTTEKNGALSMICEQIFGLHNSDLQNVVISLFASNPSSLTQTEALLDKAFEKGTHPFDVRYGNNNRYWQTKTYDYISRITHFRKYTGNDEIATLNYVPLIRLAEMYFIVIENIAPSEALPYFRTFRTARGMSAFIDEESTGNETAVLNRLEMEYRKDFFGEGQMFFFYKRHGYARFTWPAFYELPSQDVYMIPKPKTQLAFELE